MKKCLEINYLLQSAHAQSLWFVLMVNDWCKSSQIRKSSQVLGTHRDDSIALSLARIEVFRENALKWLLTPEKKYLERVRREKKVMGEDGR